MCSVLPQHQCGTCYCKKRVHTVQREECEEGMPPESTTARMSHTPCLNFFVKICTHAYHPYCNSVSSGHVRVTWRRLSLVQLKPRGRLQVSVMTWWPHMCLWVKKGTAHKACQFHDPSVHRSCFPTRCVHCWSSNDISSCSQSECTFRVCAMSQAQNPALKT